MDLPALASAPDLPALKGAQALTDGADLPAHADLPTPKSGPRTSWEEIDLPIPSDAPDFPAPKITRSFSRDEVLFPNPAPAPEKPRPVSEAPRPTPEALRPAPVDEPKPAPVANPEAYEDPFGDLDLPSSIAPKAAATPIVASPFGEIDLPAALDMPPSFNDPMADLDLRASADGLAPPSLPQLREAVQKARERVGGSGSTDYGEIDLGAGEPDSRASVEFDEFPLAEDGAQKSEDAGRGTPAELDLAANPYEHVSRGSLIDDVAQAAAAEDAKGRKSAKFEGRRRYERQSRRVRVLVLLLLVMAAAGGAGLGFTELGPFGVNVIAELLPSAGESAAVERAVEAADKKLREDTLVSLDAALRELEGVVREHPDNEDLKLFGVVLYNLRELRFSRDEASAKKGVALLGRIDLDKSESPYAPLVKASREILSGQAKSAIALLSAKGGSSPAARQLLAEAHLEARDGKRALDVAKKLAATEKSARAAFLVARALGKLGKRADAVKALEAAVAAHPRHHDARLELGAARLAGERADATRVAEAVEPLTRASDATAGAKARAFALMGRASLRQGQPREARAHFENAAALEPNDTELLVGRGFLALGADDTQGATTYFVKARGQDPLHVDAKLGHAETMIRANLAGDAKALVTEVMSENPDIPFARYLKGRVAAFFKNVEEAETDLRAAIAQDPDLIEAYVALSDLLSKAGREEEASGVLADAANRSKGSSTVKLTLAEAFAARGDFASAVSALNEALAAEPDDLPTKFRLAQMHRKLGDAVSAEKILEELVAKDPAYPGIGVERGLVFELKGQLREAAAAYESAMKTDPGDPTAKLRLGRSLMALGELEKAEPLLSEAAVAMTNSAEASYAMGALLLALERPSDAAGYLRRAVDLDKQNAEYRLRFGMAYLAMRDMGRASTEIEQARKLDPKLAEAPLRAGEIKLRTGGAKDAIVLFEEALALDPKLAEAYGLIGEAYEELADPMTALKNYERAVRQLPDHAGLNFKLGVTALQAAGPRYATAPLGRAIALAEASGASKMPAWLPEACYRLGTALEAKGEKQAAIAAFRKYLEIAPEKAIDRQEVRSRLEQLGVTP